MKGNFTRTKALEEEGGKDSRFSSFLPLMYCELIKSSPLITAHTEKRLGTSLLLRVFFLKALISTFDIVMTLGG